MGSPTREQISDIRAREIDWSDKNIIAFIEETEGNKPAVNDSRATSPIQKELTDEEVKKQEEALKEWEVKI